MHDRGRSALWRRRELTRSCSGEVCSSVPSQQVPKKATRGTFVKASDKATEIADRLPLLCAHYCIGRWSISNLAPRSDGRVRRGRLDALKHNNTAKQPLKPQPVSVIPNCDQRASQHGLPWCPLSLRCSCFYYGNLVCLKRLSRAFDTFTTASRPHGLYHRFVLNALPHISLYIDNFLDTHLFWGLLSFHQSGSWECLHAFLYSVHRHRRRQPC